MRERHSHSSSSSSSSSSGGSRSSAGSIWRLLLVRGHVRRRLVAPCRHRGSGLHGGVVRARVHRHGLVRLGSVRVWCDDIGAVVSEGRAGSGERQVLALLIAVLTCLVATAPRRPEHAQQKHADDAHRDATRNSTNHRRVVVCSAATGTATSTSTISTTATATTTVISKPVAKHWRQRHQLRTIPQQCRRAITETCSKSPPQAHTSRNSTHTYW